MLFKKADGKVDVFVSAFSSLPKYALVALCQGKTVEQDFRIKGLYNKEDINLIFNEESKSAEMPNDFSVTLPTTDVRLGNVSNTCPEGVMCLTNGTKIDINVGTFGCVDSAAISWSKRVKDNKLYLFVGAVNIGDKGSELVRCAKQNVEKFTITFPAIAFDKKDIFLRVLN